MDIHELTHPGRVRTDNQDHFLVCALRKQMVVQLRGGSERVALLMMVADGVGGVVRPGRRRSGLKPGTAAAAAAKDTRRWPAAPIRAILGHRLP